MLVQIAQSEKIKIVLLRGHFLKKFRGCPLFALLFAVLWIFMVLYKKNAPRGCRPESRAKSQGCSTGMGQEVQYAYIIKQEFAAFGQYRINWIAWKDTGKDRIKEQRFDMQGMIIGHLKQYHVIRKKQNERAEVLEEAGLDPDDYDFD